MSRITKSKDRIRKNAEVFTPIFIVKKMIDELVKEAEDVNPFELGKTFLEPSCGNGVFIGEIVQRKLSNCYDIIHGLEALKDVYAVDIQPDNVQQARCQALGQFVYWCLVHDYTLDNTKLNAATYIIDKNIVTGNFLKPETVLLYDWKEGKEKSLGVDE